MLEALGTEVDEECSAQAGGLQIIDDLRVLVAGNGYQSLEFDQNGVEAHKIDSKDAGQDRTFVRYRQGRFAPKSQATLM